MPRPSDKLRQSVSTLALAALFGGAAFTQAEVQGFGREATLDKAKKTSRYVIVKDLVPKRGTIYSADGRVLAESDGAYQLTVSFDKVPRTPGFLMELAEAAGIAEPEISIPALTGAKSRVWPEPLNDTQAAKVRAVRASWKADGVSLTPVLSRNYPYQEYASGLVGFVRNSKSVNGLEKSFDTALQGQASSISGFVDRTGTFIPDGDAKNALVNGTNVTLTVDSDLQVAAAQAVRQAVEKHKAASGSVVIMDPKTGDVLAMANWPSFTPGEAIKPGSDLNSAYMSILEPGSTFKILTLAEALDLGVVPSDFHMQCTGELEVVKGHSVKCDDHHGSRAHGDVDLTRAIAVSCNVSAATWALAIGHDNFFKYVDALGLLEKPKLGLPGEVGGRLNRHDGSPVLQLANLGFGQAINATPITLASAFCMIANDGVRMKPRLIAAVGDQRSAPVSAGQVVKPEVAHEVLHIMESVIQSDFGTGAALGIKGYTLAGKTGTAQKVGKHGAKGYVSNFVGMVPSNHPRAVILVMINDPHVGYYGASVAGPVFNELAKDVIRRFDIPPDSSGAAPVADPALSDEARAAIRVQGKASASGPVDLEVETGPAPGRAEGGMRAGCQAVR